MLTIDPKEYKTAQLHAYLLGAVAPRPIALASTVDAEGNPNLSPFSFFNVFSSNPPIAIFSPARSGRTNTTKNTLDNVKEVGEVVINVVNYDIVQQTSLASTEFAKGVNEFTKSGLTPIASEKVRPFRVKESPAQLECRVKEVIELGAHGGAGNLVVCEILLVHISKEVLDEQGVIDPNKIDLVGRLGGDWYSRASGDSLFKVPKPLLSIGIGYDNIPEWIRTSDVLTGNDLGMLGNIEAIPSEDDVKAFMMNEQALPNEKRERRKAAEQKAKQLLKEHRIADAWKMLLAAELN